MIWKKCCTLISFHWQSERFEWRQDSSANAFNLLKFFLRSSGSSYEYRLYSIGRDILFPNWRKYFEFYENALLNHIRDFSLTLQQRFPTVFDCHAEMHLEDNARSIFCGPYTVEYGIRETVDKEIDRPTDLKKHTQKK